MSYATRGYEGKYISDEDDLYQEACYWLINCMWEWDDDRGISLERYVVYNLGVRLRNIVKSEAVKKRGGDCIKIPIGKKDEENNIVEEECLEVLTLSPEKAFRLKEFQEYIKTKSFLVNKLLECLLLENGNFSGACRMLRPYVRDTDSMTEDSFRRYVEKKFLADLRKDAISANII